MRIMWLLIAAVASTAIVGSGFLFVMTAKRLLETGAWIPREIKLLAYVWLAIGWPADMAYNVIVGSWRFRQPPKLRFWYVVPYFQLYSGRIQDLVSSGSGWRHEKAMRWAAFLNSVDANHIRL